jgi:hypothetical protein
MFMNNSEKFNFCIARAWSASNDQLCVYMFHNQEILYGDAESAAERLKYVLTNSTHSDWRIVKIPFNG